MAKAISESSIRRKQSADQRTPPRPKRKKFARKIAALEFREARYRHRWARPMRGRYRKREARVEGDNLACAWTLGDARSFAGARSRCLEGIVFDPKLSGAQHRVLAHCLKHMNAGARWSCFVSIPRLAEEAECSETACWRALHDADGTHILTKRGTHACHDVTFVTIHPNYKLSNLRSRESKRGDKLSNLNEQASKFASTSFQKCEENFLTRTSIKEPPADQSY